MTIEDMHDNLVNGNFTDVAEEIVRRGTSLTSILDEMTDLIHESNDPRDLIIVADMIIDIERENAMRDRYENRVAKQYYLETTFQTFGEDDPFIDFDQKIIGTKHDVYDLARDAVCDKGFSEELVVDYFLDNNEADIEDITFDEIIKLSEDFGICAMAAVINGVPVTCTSMHLREV